MSEYEIELIDYEIILAETLGNLRCRNSEGKNTQNFGTDMTIEQRNINAVGAEMAFCKWLNVWPDLTTFTRKGGCDCKWGEVRIEIKNTPTTKHRLQVKQNGHPYDSDIFVLVRGGPIAYEITGWCSRGAIIRPELLTNPGFAICYQLTMDKLNPIADLRKWLFVLDRAIWLANIDKQESVKWQAK
jgi:hypothetical protein